MSEMSFVLVIMKLALNTIWLFNNLFKINNRVVHIDKMQESYIECHEYCNCSRISINSKMMENAGTLKPTIKTITM